MKLYAILFVVFILQNLLALLSVYVGFRMGRRTAGFYK